MIIVAMIFGDYKIFLVQRRYYIFCQFFPRNFPNDSVFTASGATPQNNAVISFSYSLIVPTEIVMVFFPLCEVIKAQMGPRIR